MALLTGLVGKNQLNGKLGWLERPVNNSRQRWSVLFAREEAVVSMATQTLVRVPPSELGNVVTNLMAQMDHGAVQRFLSLMDSRSQNLRESKAVQSSEAPPSPVAASDEKGDLPPEIARTVRRLSSHGQCDNGPCTSDPVRRETAREQPGWGMEPSMQVVSSVLVAARRAPTVLPRQTTTTATTTTTTTTVLLVSRASMTCLPVWSRVLMAVFMAMGRLTVCAFFALLQVVWS